MEGRQLILNDGTIIPNGEAGLSGGFLWLYLPGYTIQQAAAVAFDSNKTSVIVFDYGDLTDTFNGFTSCVNISAEDGQSSVCLIQP